MEFSAHGDFTLTIDDNILIIRVDLPWNVECAEEFTQQVQSLVNETFVSKNQPFDVMCVIGSDWFPTFDSTEFFLSLTNWGVENGLRCDAFVTESSSPQYLLEKLFQPKQYDHFKYAFFSSETDALKWLRSD